MKKKQKTIKSNYTDTYIEILWLDKHRSVSLKSVLQSTCLHVMSILPYIQLMSLTLSKVLFNWVALPYNASSVHIADVLWQIDPSIHQQIGSLQVLLLPNYACRSWHLMWWGKMLTNVLLLPLCFRQKTGHSERSFFPGVSAWKSFYSQAEVLLCWTEDPSPAPLSFKALGTLNKSVNLWFNCSNSAKSVPTYAF